ncbi:hypothetical protein HDV63DRAFT_404576 [Trichoderma sp. SZMC 28014]
MLMTDGECVREPLKAFFDNFDQETNRLFWKRLLDALNAAVKRDASPILKGPNLLELRDSGSSIAACQDKEHFIVSLYNSLAEYCYCRCILGCDFMAANIHLYRNDESSVRIDKASKFNLLFQDCHDLQKSQSFCFWRDVEISAVENPRAPDDISEDRDIEDLELLTEHKLCELITAAQDCQSQVQLIHSKGELRLKKSQGMPSIRFLTNVPSTSLADLLHDFKLTDKNKMILSYLLVESVWQYYNSGWEDWSHETIQFMSQPGDLREGSKMIYVNQLFLHVRFYRELPPKAKSSTLTAGERSVGKGKLQNPQPAFEEIGHKYPRIFALGIMLLEIQLGNKIESFKNSGVYDKNPLIVRYLLASEILKDKKLWPPKDTWLVIREIIETCIHGEKAKAILKGDRNKVRQNIYDNIVAPFRAFTLGAWEEKGIEDVEPVMLEKVPQSEKGVSRNGESSSKGREPDQRLTQSSKSAVEWLHKLNELADTISMVGKRDKNNCPEIKVAILDTGITKECFHRCRASIEEYKDFAPGEDELQQDRDEHGSNALRLLLKLNGDVKVFVGRVFKSKVADDDTESVMAKAILHAKRQWKVDIICIPSGFSHRPSNISFRDELYDAVSATAEDVKTLIFAAASNLGLTSEVTFPGCLSQSSKLLCLFATAGDGEPSRFNPAAVPGAYNLALLGEGIKINPEDQPIGGTSFSAVVAAAIAAYIMDFANHPDVKGKIDGVRYLREVEGMTSVFASMTAVQKNGYHILEPWRLMNYDRYKSMEITDQRKEIRRNISEALGRRDKRQNH